MKAPIDISAYADMMMPMLSINPSPELLALQCKALADPTRLRILALLLDGERCVCDLTAALAMGQSKVSRHLSVLRNADWVIARRGGKWMYYRLGDSPGVLQAGFARSLSRLKGEVEDMLLDQERLCHHLAAKSSESCD